jgi:DegV family protein with EDD domain
MPEIALVTDSTAYIPPEIVDRYSLTVVPQVLIWGENTYQDGVDIQPDEFYSRLQNSKIMPTTSQVSIASMKTTFEDLTGKGYHVIGIFISSKFSGTIQSAIQAIDMMGSAGKNVTILDSLSTSMALGFQVLAAARVLEDGANLEDVIATAEKARDHTGVFFAVDTLEFLHRGGRIGGAKRFFGTALNVKPVLTLNDGHIEAVEQIRTKKKAIARVMELVEEQVKGRSPIHLASLHANAEAEAKELLEMASKRVDVSESIFTTVSPVVGTHAGPGPVGLAYMADM